MLKQKPKYDVVEKFKVFRTIYDKIFILFSGFLWIFSTLWDIYKLQRYWLDYTAELYGCFFIINMMIFSINPKLLPIKIYNSFSLITTIKGRGVLLLLISSLFLNDSHSFHKFIAILLFIGGILYFICEILVPTTREELEQIESFYKTNNNINNNNNNNININNINNINIKNNQNNYNNREVKTNNNDTIKNNSSILEKSNAIFNAINLNTNLNAEIGETNNDIIEEEKEQNEESTRNNENNNKNNEENQNNNDNKDILVEEEIVRKTDNPYEIPEDF